MIVAQVLENPESAMDIRSLVLAVFALLEVMVRLTPSEKDNSIVNKVVTFGAYILDFIIPNRRKGGGRIPLIKRKNA
tara:strand:+ start:625 stop:855 length:231 start_codon:yes stop_codon:yes gene_type:complete